MKKQTKNHKLELDKQVGKHNLLTSNSPQGVIPLDEKELDNQELHSGVLGLFGKKDVKNSIQEVQKRFKEFLEGEWITNRILAEYRKHKNLNWAKIAQGKIRSNINSEFDQILRKECGKGVVK